MKTKGFTLIELMIVVAIIGILAAVVLPALGVKAKLIEQKCINGVLMTKQGNTWVSPMPEYVQYCDDGTNTQRNF